MQLIQILKTTKNYTILEVCLNELYINTKIDDAMNYFNSCVYSYNDSHIMFEPLHCCPIISSVFLSGALKLYPHLFSLRFLVNHLIKKIELDFFV